jgi:hypothetical protein
VERSASRRATLSPRAAVWHAAMTSTNIASQIVEISRMIMVLGSYSLALRRFLGVAPKNRHSLALGGRHRVAP